MMDLARMPSQPMKGYSVSRTPQTHMKRTLIATALVLSLFPALASAGTVKLPKDKPAAAIAIPDDWEPEDSDDGILAESPDNVSTVYFEVVANEKEMNTVIEDSLKWLTEEHEVKVDAATKEEKDFEDAGRKWSRISWSGNSKEYGPAIIGFLFTEVGEGKVLTVTYWISKKDSDKSLETLGKIFSSVKTIK